MNLDLYRAHMSNLMSADPQKPGLTDPASPNQPTNLKTCAPPRVGRSIGALAAELGLTLRTLRYYEQVGLLQPHRTTGGDRLYDEDQCERARCVAQMRSFDLTIEDVRRVLGIKSLQARNDELAALLMERIAQADAETRRTRAFLTAIRSGVGLPLPWPDFKDVPRLERHAQASLSPMG